MVIKRVLIVGATGLLGKALIENCPANIQLFVTYLRDCWKGALPCPSMRLDVSDRQEILRVINEWALPDIVIHAAGIGDVDFAENNRSLSRAVNVEGVNNIINACKEGNIKLIYVSSNAVFDGKTPPYAEDSSRRPVNYYGHLKVEAEDLVLKSGLNCCIVRAVLMYGWHFHQSRANKVTNWIRSLSEGKEIYVVNDRYSQPLWVEDCSNLIWEVANQNKLGVYHVSGNDRITLVEFAQKAAEVFGLDGGLIKSVPSSYFPQIAPRPVDTSFLTKKIRDEIGFCPVGIIEGLQRMKKASERAL